MCRPDTHACEKACTAQCGSENCNTDQQGDDELLHLHRIHSPQRACTIGGSLLSQAANPWLPNHSSPKSCAACRRPLTSPPAPGAASWPLIGSVWPSGNVATDRPPSRKRCDECVGVCDAQEALRSRAMTLTRRSDDGQRLPVMVSPVAPRQRDTGRDRRRADDAAVQQAELIRGDRPVLPRRLSHQRISPLLRRRLVDGSVGVVHHLRRRGPLERHRAVRHHGDRAGRVVLTPFVLDGRGCLEEGDVRWDREQRRVTGLGGRDRRCCCSGRRRCLSHLRRRSGRRAARRHDQGEQKCYARARGTAQVAARSPHSLLLSDQWSRLTIMHRINPFRPTGQLGGWRRPPDQLLHGQWMIVGSR